MAATLVVDSSGSPVPRPKVDVRIAGQTLHRVQETHRISIVVRAITAATGIRITVKRGAKLLTSKAIPRMPAGAIRRLSLALTASGRQALKNLEQAAISARATVAFGRADSASRTLH